MRLLVLLLSAFIWSEGAVSATRNTPQEAGIQAKVDNLTVGILAGRLKPGQRNGMGIEATFKGPRDIAVDSNGNLFIADDSIIRKITPEGRVSTFAGSTRGYADGPGEVAQFGSTILGLAIDSNDNIYVADSSNRRIRKITPDGYVSTLAGQGQSGYRNRWGVDARFKLPRGIAVDSKGNVYVGDDKNNKIRKIAPNGEVEALAPRAEFSQPRSIAIDGMDNVYVLDGITIKKIMPDGSIQLMAANMKFDPAANKENRAKFSGRAGLAADNSGNLYISSVKDKKIYKISPDGTMYVVAGMENVSWVGRPNNITVGANGNIYVADDHNHLVHQITPAGNVGPLPGLDIPQVASAQRPVMPEQAYKSAATKKEEAALFAATKAKAKKNPQAKFELAGMYYEGRGVARNQAEGLKLYKKAAKKIVEAHYILGNIYIYRKSLPQHEAKKFGWFKTDYRNAMFQFEGKMGAYYDYKMKDRFKKAAKKGHAASQYEYGKSHYEGKVQYWRVVTNGDEAAADAAQIQKRYKNANEWYLKSANQGYDKAQYALAMSYVRGEGVAVDGTKAIELFTKAAEQDNIDAQFELAEIFRKGEVTNQDYAKSVMWYGKVAEQGDIYAQAMFGALTRALDTTTPIKQIYIDAAAQTDLGMKHYVGDGVEQDYAKAAELFDGVVTLGETDAQWMFGWQYERGEGVAQNYGQALTWYNIAAELGHSDAQFRLGYLHHKGLGTYQNSAEAVYWYNKAAEQGHVLAQLSLGQMYSQGDGVYKDYAAALEWYNRAGKNGDVQALYNAGLMYSMGQGTEINDERSIELYALAAEQGHLSADKFMTIYKKANAGETTSQIYLASMYSNGDEVRQDYSMVRDWFAKAAELGDNDGRYKLGLLYLFDFGKLRKDYKQAITWLTLAADDGHEDAKEWLEYTKDQKFREDFGNEAGDIRAIIRSLKGKKRK